MNHQHHLSWWIWLKIQTLIDKMRILQQYLEATAEAEGLALPRVHVASLQELGVRTLREHQDSDYNP